MTTNLIVGCSQTESGHFDVRSKLSNRHALVVILLVGVVEHADVDVLVEDVQARPVGFQNMVIVLIVVFTDVVFQLRQLLCPNDLTQIDANDLLVEAEGVSVEELRAFRCAPGSSVHYGTIDESAGLLTFLA